MRLRTESLALLFMVGFLVLPVATSVLLPPGPVVVTGSSQGPMEMLPQLIESGAEVIYTHVDSEGRPAVLYGQIALPGVTGVFNLDADMYDGCLAVAVLAVRGELLDYLFELMGMGGNDSGPGDLGFAPAQDGGIGGPGDIIDYLGDEFSIVVGVYMDLEEGVAAGRMAQVVQQLAGSPLAISVSSVFSIRLDESMFPGGGNNTGGSNISSLDLFVYTLSNPMSQLIQNIVGTFTTGGMLTAMDADLFVSAPGSAAALVGLPHIEDLVGLVSSSSMNRPRHGFVDYVIAQAPQVQGPVAVGIGGFVRDQIVQAGDTEMLLSDAIGSTGTITPFSSTSQGMSIVAIDMGDTSITGIEPYDANHSYYTDGTAFWAASMLGPQSDYIVHFNETSYPPLVQAVRTFSPASPTVGSPVTVTITVTNAGSDTISDIEISDARLTEVYPQLSVDGSLVAHVPSLAPGAETSLTYTVVPEYEGVYGFFDGRVTYTFEGQSYTKSIRDAGLRVVPSLSDLFMNSISAGWPLTGIVLGLVGLGAVFNLARLRSS